MKISSALPIAAAAAALSLAPAAFAETGGLADPKFEQKLDALWDGAAKTFYSPKTNLFYTAPVDKMPSPEEIAEYKPLKKNGDPNYMGGGTGIEDCSMLCGIMLVGLCDKYELTGDAETAEWARRIARGLMLADTVHGDPGFVARGVSPSDGKSVYPETSRDQYTHCVHGLYKYFKSPLATAEGKKLAAEICAAIADRMLENVRPGTNYDALNADGSPSTRGLSRMWNVAPHEAARLPMIYAVANFMTGDEKYERECKKYAAEAVAQSKKFSRNMAPWAQLQMQASLEVLRDFAETDAQREEIVGIMREVSKLAAERLRGAVSGLLDPNLDLYRLPPNPQKMPLSPEGKPEIGEFFEGPHRKARYFGEMALTMLALGGGGFDKSSAKLLAEPFGKIDYGRMTSCAVLFHLATYWSAKKAGALE